jgi:hypothetical protein
MPGVTSGADIYNYCLTTNVGNFIQVLTGKFPFFYLRSDMAVMSFLQQGKRPERSKYLPTTVTNPMWECLEYCWIQDPTERPHITSVVMSLETMSVTS